MLLSRLCAATETRRPEMSSSLAIVDAFENLEAGERGLLRAQSNPFLDEEWFRSFSRYVAPAIGEEQWLCLKDGEACTAMLPLLALSNARNQTLSSMANYYSPYFGIIGDATPDIAHCLISRASDQLAPYKQITLSPMIHEPSANLEQAFRGAGWLTHRYAFSGNWREEDIADFGKYWQRRPSRLRNSVRRKTRKLPAGASRFELITDAVSDKQLFDFHQVYRRSWKPKEPFPAFIDALIHSLAARGELRMGILHIKGTPVAAQVWAQRGTTAYIYKLAYRDEMAVYSPGTLLSHRMFEWVIEDFGATTVDYLTGDDAYKKSWVSRRETLYGLECCNPKSLVGWARHVRNSISEIRQGVRNT